MKNDVEHRRIPAPFKVGDRVRTSWPNWGESPPWVTRVESIWQSNDSNSGWVVVGAASEPCPHCGAIYPRTPAIDAGWFTSVPS